MLYKKSLHALLTAATDAVRVDSMPQRTSHRHIADMSRHAAFIGLVRLRGSLLLALLVLLITSGGAG
jgi:hypothetical protein